MRHLPRAFVVSIAIAVALSSMAIGAGASAPAKTKPAPWAKSVCGGLGTWLDKIDVAAAKAGATPPTSPAEGKKALVKLVGASLKATKKLVATLKKTGPPAVKGGGEVSSIVIDQFNQVAQSFAGVQRSVKALSADDPVAFVAASRAAQDALESGLEQVQAGFNAASTLDVPELVAAFNAEPSCQALTA